MERIWRTMRTMRTRFASGSEASMALTVHTPCGRHGPEPERPSPPAPASGTVQALRRTMLPLALVLYCVAIPGLIVAGTDSTAGHVFTAMAALGAALSLLGIAGRRRPVRLSRW